MKESIAPNSLVRALAIPGGLLDSPTVRVANFCGSRSYPASALLPRIQQAARDAGMSRLADIAGLDRLGIPVFSATLPNADPGLITTFNGKGRTREDAKVSAMMELIERASASARGRECLQGSYRDLRLRFGDAVVHPRTLILHARPLSVEPVPLAWVWAYDLATHRPSLVPATSVWHPYYDDAGPLFVNNSCGLAAGATLLEATLQALYEVIERDAVSLAMASGVFTSVPLDSIEWEPAREMLARFEQGGVCVSIKEAATDLGLPVFIACGDDRRLQNSFYLNGGFGAHAQREVALLRALTELAQSRATIISGAREDIGEMRAGNGEDYASIRAANERWFSDVFPVQSYCDLPSFDHPDLWSELEDISSRVRRRGLAGPLLVDLTRPELGVPVVRVLVPGLECWHRDRRRIGTRLIRAFRAGHRCRTCLAGSGLGARKEPTV
jgi:ribosomal protein S12 methylthiotransferase accessory factor